MRRIIVTGTGGVLGYSIMALAEQYRQERGDVFAPLTSRDVDLTDQKATEAVFALGADVIIHCAAKSGGVGISQAAPATLLRDNVLMSFNVLEAARKMPGCKVILTLSGGMYPPSESGDLWEFDIHKGPPHESNYAYAYAKRMIEPMIRAYRSQYGLDVIGLVPDAMYGPGDYFGLDHANMTASLIRKLYEAHQSGEAAILWGDGTPVRQLTYAPDIARAYMWALDHYSAALPLNVATTETATVREVAELIQEAMGVRVPLHWDRNRPNGPARKVMQTGLFQTHSKLEWTPLREGIAKTVEWYRDTVAAAPETLRQEAKV